MTFTQVFVEKCNLFHITGKTGATVRTLEIFTVMQKVLSLAESPFLRNETRVTLTHCSWIFWVQCEHLLNMVTK